MNEISLIYYGHLNEVEQHLLYLLKVLKLSPKTEAYSGFYAIETRYGKKSVKKLSLNIVEPGSEAVLIYRYLSNVEIESILNSQVSCKYYILPHKMIALEYLKNLVKTSVSQTWYIADTSKASFIHDQFDVAKTFNTKNIFKISVSDVTAIINQEKKSSVQLPVIVLFLMKAMFNPFSEFGRYYILLQYSNIRILSRMIELVGFLRYLILIMVFKSYGFIYDLCMFAYRFSKLILLYPLFKVYWFTSFQYNKRLKRYFYNDE